MSSGNTQLYAPRPQGPPTHFYPPPNENALQVPSLHPSPSPSRTSDDYSANGYRKEGRIGVDYRQVTRTPSPTPSEAEALVNKTQSFNLKKFLDPSYLKNPRNLISLIVTILILALVIVFIVEQNNIVKALRPVAQWMRKTPGGWLIPIGIMIILSFPPLFGHEIVALLCGDVWGIGIGFAIVAAGTLLGELVTYYTFRYCCKARGEKAEQKNLRFGLLSEVIREGGFKMAIIVRYSAIPGHLTTAIFATCGMGVLTFLVAAVLSLPKQFATVYLGTGTVDANGDVQPSHTQKIVKIVLIVITTIVTMGAMRYVNGQIDNVKQEVIYKRRKARQAKLAGASASSFPFKPAHDDDPEDVTPLVPRAGGNNGYARVSMDHADVHVPTPAYTNAGYAQQQQQQPVPTFAPPRSPPPNVYGTEARYDDAYGGRDALSTGGLRTPAGSSPGPASSTRLPQ
ncbi:hypothetical protein BD309DRAFT_1010793 [Dichomitus squalens]|nr:hypothetical protein BD309DRAFT_1010793 [Dichomitus squalens]